MEKRIVIIISSILAASLFLPGGYGSWTDELVINGGIAIVQPIPAPILMIMPVPTTVPTTIPIPAQDEVVPIIEGADSTTTTNNSIPVDIGLPDNSGTDQTQEDSTEVIEEGAGYNTGQQNKTDEEENIEEAPEEEAAASEVEEDNTNEQGEPDDDSPALAGTKDEEKPADTDVSEDNTNLLQLEGDEDN